MGKILTTTQKTFVDLYDSYSISISPEIFAVDCDIAGNTVLETKHTINYSVNAKGTQIAARCVSVECSNTLIVFDYETNQGSSIVVTIPSGIILGESGTVSAKVTIETTDNAKFVFERYVTFMKSSSGANGTDGESAISFRLYSALGDTFKEDVPEIAISTAAFSGSTRISGEKYEWYYYNAASGAWVTIDSNDPALQNSDGTVLTVKKEYLYSLSTIKCIMTYDGAPYEDYMLLKSVNAYSASIKFLKGSNIFGENDDAIIAYVALYKDGQEVDQLITDEFYYSGGAEPEITTDSDGKQIIDAPDLMQGSYVQGQQVYFVCTDGQNFVHVVLGELEENSATERWVVKECHKEYVYENSLRPNGDLMECATSKFLVIRSSDIETSKDISFKAYKSAGGGHDLFVAETNISINNLNGLLENTISTTNRVNEYMVFNPDTGLKISKSTDQFYVNISSTQMDFVDNTDGNNKTVVSIGNESALIRDLVVEDGAKFDCDATFNQNIILKGFMFQVESNGSLSLVTIG